MERYMSDRFNNRVKNDKIGMLHRDIANKRSTMYATMPLNTGSAASDNSFAANNYLQFNNIQGSGIPSEVIHDEARLRYGQMSSNEMMAGQIHKKQRPYATVPYLGRGPAVDAGVEFSLMAGMRNLSADEIIEAKAKSITAASSHAFRPKGSEMREIPEMPSSWTYGGEYTHKTMVPKNK